MPELFSNAAQTTLNGSITNVASTMVVTSATGFPSSGDFRCLISAEGANTNEIVTVTAVSSTTFTISRATEAYAGVTAASAHASGATVTHVLTALALSNTFSTMGPIDAAAMAAVGSGDLFRGTTLDGGWSDLQSSHTTQDRTVDGFLTMTHSGNSGGQDRGIKRAFSPAGDFTVYCKMNWARLAANYMWAGLFIADSTASDSGNRLDLFLLRNGTMQVKFAKELVAVETTVFGYSISSSSMDAAQANNDGNAYFPIWLRIKRASTTLTAGISWDGIAWVDQATTTTIAFTVANVGLFIAESSATNNQLARWDYIATTG